MEITPEDKNHQSSINNAINYFESNLIEMKCKIISDISFKKRKSSTSSRSGVNKALSNISRSNDFKTSKKDESFSRIIYDLTHSRGSFPVNNINTNYSQSESPESVTITSNSLNSPYNHIIQQSHKKLSNKSPITLLKNTIGKTSDYSISDTLRYFQQPTLSNSKKLSGNNENCHNMLHKVVEEFCKSACDKTFFSKFVSIFNEKFKLAITKRVIEMEDLCSSITHILMDTTSNNSDAIIDEIKHLVTKLINGKLSCISKLIQSGFIDIQLLTLSLLAHSLSQSIQFKFSKLQENRLFKSKSIQFFNEALIINGDSLLPKVDGISNFFNEIERTKIISDENIQKMYDKQPITVLLSRNK